MDRRDKEAERQLAENKGWFFERIARIAQMIRRMGEREDELPPEVSVESLPTNGMIEVLIQRPDAITDEFKSGVAEVRQLDKGNENPRH